MPIQMRRPASLAWDMDPRDFEVLEHPADIGFRAFGGTLPELFARSALAHAFDCRRSRRGPAQGRIPAGRRERRPRIAAGGLLNEVLYWFDGKRIAFRDFSGDAVLRYGHRGRGHGEPRDPLRHRARLIVKAVTYHQLKIERRSGLWWQKCTWIFDNEDL